MSGRRKVASGGGNVFARLSEGQAFGLSLDFWPLDAGDGFQGLGKQTIFGRQAMTML